MNTDIAALKQKIDRLNAAISRADNDHQLISAYGNKSDVVPELLRIAEQLQKEKEESDDRISWLETQREVECQQKIDAQKERDELSEDLSDQLERANIAHNELTGRYLRVQDQNVDLQHDNARLKERSAQMENLFRETRNCEVLGTLDVLREQLARLQAERDKCVEALRLAVVQLGHIDAGKHIMDHASKQSTKA